MISDLVKQLEVTGAQFSYSQSVLGGARRSNASILKTPTQ